MALRDDDLGAYLKRIAYAGPRAPIPTGASRFWTASSRRGTATATLNGAISPMPPISRMC